MFHCEYARMVVEELKTVALLDEVAVGIVGKCDAILCGSSSGCVIREDVAVECGQLSAILPSCRFSSVRSRISNGVINKRFTVVRHKLVAVVIVGVELASGITQTKIFASSSWVTTGKW